MEGKKQSGLRTRVITGVIFSTVVLGLLTYDRITASILLVLITAFCTFEYTNIARKGIKDPTFNLTMLCGLGPILFSFVKPELAEGYEFFILMISFCIMLSFSIFSLILNVRTNHNLLSPIIVLFYLGLPMAAIDRLLVQSDQYEQTILLGILFSLWVSDSGAYFVGRWLGKTPLHRRVSPKKTIEGWLGGGLFAALFAYLLSLYFTDLTLLQWMIIMLVGWLAGSWGDLYESSIKRQFDVKDSGILLPGHGGFLDRFDSFIFAAPAVLLALYTFFNL
jgi:phosphatidate cytidylyltransferase